MNGKGKIYNVVISGREIEIKTTFHPGRNTEQTTYLVGGDLEGTHIEGGLGGVTTVNDPKELLEMLEKEVQHIMITPPEQGVATEG